MTWEQTKQKIIPTESEATLINQDCSSKDTIRRVKIKSTELKKKFAIDISDKVFLSKTYFKTPAGQ